MNDSSSKTKLKSSLNEPAAPGAIVQEYKFTVIETHLDLFGHMNNAVYLQVFEEARWALTTQRGYGLSEIMKRKQGPTILEIELSFKKELKNRTDVTIKTWCSDYVGKVGHLIQTMENVQGEECARVVMAFGLFDLESRRLIDGTPEWRRAIGL